MSSDRKRDTNSRYGDGVGTTTERSGDTNVEKDVAHSQHIVTVNHKDNDGWNRHTVGGSHEEDYANEMSASC